MITEERKELVALCGIDCGICELNMCKDSPELLTYLVSRGIPKDKSVRQNVVHRLKIARGHLDKVIEMAEKDKYCIDIINQSVAVQSALKKVDEILLKNHLQTCAVDAIKHGRSTSAVDEIIKVYEKR